MSEREHRIVENEDLFRTVNERIEGIVNDLGMATVTEEADFVCECGDAACTGKVRVQVNEYERVRGNSHWFLIKPGHEIPDVEDVIERHSGYLVVEKHEETIEHARELDDRTN